MLESLQDDDGLISLQNVDFDPIWPRKLFLKTNHQQVYIEPNAFGVADIILNRPDLISIAKLQLHESDLGMKGVPIFGLSFDLAVEKAKQARPRFLLKSMFKLIDPDKFHEYGLCATLVVHIRKDPEYIQIEAWQFIGAYSITYYLHGLLDSSCETFNHLDGATMIHEEDDARMLFENGIKMKGSYYQKRFRLDGVIDTKDALTLASAYLPNEQLNAEYFETSCESAI
ncbi:hypothetical protein [Geomobilimonas luticola]|uniref:Uncharacterized protein n=1 Tax=Geomobilimonas luticola TaxID=1114878 RepID=A0ABS5SB76_9BACT|nr:hypothetical protein [Geomobilimonas luticola]MBT0652611.1 hypothetical protein [Geomobilimonas luticola]